jgi:ribosome-associated protein
VSPRIAGRRRGRRPEPHPVGIAGEVIRLGQLLKLADLVETGAEAKDAVAAGEVSVNGEVETRRGRQLRLGDVVERHGVPPVRVSAEGEGDGDVDVPW